jgi:hypothetical protein
MLGIHFRERSVIGVSLAFLFWMTAPPALADAAGSNVWSRWITTIKAMPGYTVTQGSASTGNCAIMLTVFKSCGINNPAGGYIAVEPPVDNEFVDPCYNSENRCTPQPNGGDGGTNSISHLATVNGTQVGPVNAFYRIDKNQALVTVINLPPQLAYFGFQTYLYSRATSDYGKNCFPKMKSPDPCRILVVGSVSNAINNASIFKQTGLPLALGHSSGAVAIITTADTDLYNQLAAMFASAGGDTRQLFPEPLTTVWAGTKSATVHTGLDTGATYRTAAADELLSLIRYTIPNNTDPDHVNLAAFNEWLNDVSSNVQVYRVGAPAGGQPFPAVAIAAKHYTTDETVYKKALSELVSDAKLWVASISPAGSVISVRKMTTSEKVEPSDAPNTGQPYTHNVGPVCIHDGRTCSADTQDTDAYRYVVLPGMSHTAVIVGVNSAHPFLNNATYISVGAYITRYLFSPGNALSATNPSAAGFDSGTLAGSAADFVGQMETAGMIAPSATLKAALPYLFVAIQTLDCAVSPPASAVDFCNALYTSKLDGTQFDPSESIMMIRRAYLRPFDPAHPNDTNGANPDYLLTPEVIYFNEQKSKQNAQHAGSMETKNGSSPRH